MVAEGRVDGRVTDMRQRILATALRLFLSNGFAATSLQTIARELGVTKAAVYYHFPAKAALAREIFQPFIDDVDAMLARIEAEPMTQREVLVAYVEALLPHRDVFAAMLRDPTGLGEVDLAGASLRWLDRIPAVLVGHRPSRREQIRATVALGGLSRVLLLPDVSDRDLRTIAIDSALAALTS